MSRKYSYTETATDWNLWTEYVDPEATMTEEEFNELSVEEKVAMQVQCFGQEDIDWQNSDEHGDWLLAQ